MSYTMVPGEVYQLARSLRHPDVFGLPVGKFAPDVVTVDEETAAEMEYSGVLVYMDENCVAVFTHPEDQNFVLGQPVDPEAEEATPVAPTEEEVEEEEQAAPTEEALGISEQVISERANPTPEQMAEWGYDHEAICDGAGGCGYYIRDHVVLFENDSPSLECPASEG